MSMIDLVMELGRTQICIAFTTVSFFIYFEQFASSST
jgi:hypothetical protein